jgi:hypothetical protein
MNRHKKRVNNGISVKRNMGINRTDGRPNAQGSCPRPTQTPINKINEEIIALDTKSWGFDPLVSLRRVRGQLKDRHTDVALMRIVTFVVAIFLERCLRLFGCVC